MLISSWSASAGVPGKAMVDLWRAASVEVDNSSWMIDKHQQIRSYAIDGGPERCNEREELMNDVS